MITQPTTDVQSCLAFFFSLIPSLVVEYRAIERIHLKIVGAKARLNFLRRCIEEKVIPRSMSWLWRISNDEPFPKEAMSYMRNAITDLRVEIDQLYYKLR